MQKLLPVILMICFACSSGVFAAYYGSEEFEAILDNKTGTSLSLAYNVQLLRQGEESFPVREHVIRDAERYLLIQTFIFRRDQVSEGFLDLIVERAEEGINVQFIYDWLGSVIFSPLFLCSLKELPIDVRAHVAFWGDQRGVNRIWHEKIIVADGSSAIIGGMHFDEATLDPPKPSRIRPARDLDIHVEGPIVKHIQDSFVENWGIVGGEELHFIENDPVPYECNNDEGLLMRFVSQKPLTHRDYRINNLYVEAIDAAKETIYLESPFFSPAFDIMNALVKAARRGVEIKILINSFCTTDLIWRYPFARLYYLVFLREGIELYEMHGRMTHAKYALFDGVYSIVGSYNLDFRSAYLDTECVVAYYSTELTGELTRWFEEGLTEARKPLTLFW